LHISAEDASFTTARTHDHNKENSTNILKACSVGTEAQSDTLALPGWVNADK